MNIEELDLIEKYIFKKLQGDELKVFEAKLIADPGFKEKVERHEIVIKNIKSYGERIELKNKLNFFHEEMDAESSDTISSFSFRSYFRKHRTTIAVAASVALISVSSTLFTVNYIRSVDQSHNAEYKELKREITRIKSSQKAILNDLNSSDIIVSDPEAGGTGFLISSDGYLVTSYHLVKGAGKIFAENEKYGLLKTSVIAADRQHDLALLKIEGEKIQFRQVPLSIASGRVKLGEKVFTLGYPKDDIVYGEGSLSSLSGFESDSASCQVSVPVNPGNSGSPLFNDKGQLIGMVSGKQIESEAASFALKAEFIQQLIKNDSLEIRLGSKHVLKGLPRTVQLDKLKDIVFSVKVYEK
jgi:serine protease Do